MPKTMTCTMDLSDEETANFLARIAERGQVAVAETGEESEATISTTDVSGQVDSAGVPWSADWHSGAKSKTAGGAWRLKKGVDAKAYEAAIPSLKGSMSGPAASAASAPVAGLPGFTPAAPAMGLPGFPASAPQPEPVSYEQVVGRYQELAGANKITPEQVPGIYAAAGVTDPAELMTNETLRRKLFDELNKYAA